MRFAAGSQIFQRRPQSTDAETAYTADAKTEVMLIVVCNNNAAARTFSLYHDDDGTTYTADTRLFNEVDIEGDTTVSIAAEGGPGTGFTVAVGGTIGVQSSAVDDLTFTAYGVTEDVAPRMLTR